MERAFASWRISLRHLVKEEINKFLEIFDKCYKSVKQKGTTEMERYEEIEKSIITTYRKKNME